MVLPYFDRVEAGRILATHLAHLAGRDVVVLGLPRGGVPVAAEVARALGAPLDVVVVRKLGVPFQPELAMGAIGEGGLRFLDHEVVAAAAATSAELEAVERRERVELDRRARAYRRGRPAEGLAGRVAIIVDDGIATGATARVACMAARARGAARVVFATPVGPRASIERLREAADEVVCPETPASFFAIGEFYEDFAPTGDDEVRALLDAAAAAPSTAN